MPDLPIMCRAHVMIRTMLCAAAQGGFSCTTRGGVNDLSLQLQQRAVTTTGRVPWIRAVHLLASSSCLWLLAESQICNPAAVVSLALRPRTQANACRATAGILPCQVNDIPYGWTMHGR